MLKAIALTPSQPCGRRSYRTPSGGMIRDAVIAVTAVFPNGVKAKAAPTVALGFAISMHSAVEIWIVVNVAAEVVVTVVKDDVATISRR